MSQITPYKPDIIITGSAGFIGTHLADYYLKREHKVLGLDNYITGSKSNTDYLLTQHPQHFKFYKHDITLPWPDIETRSTKYIFHFASPAAVKIYQKYPLETMMANSMGLLNALNIAGTQNTRVVFASTSEIYGSPLSSPQKENDWGNVNSFGARSCYDESKRYGEALIYSTNSVKKTKHGVIRIFNTYGPRMNFNDDRAPCTFILKALQQKDLNIYGTGQQTRSFCYIDDLINGIDRYASSSITEPVNLGNDHEITILSLAHSILKMTQSNSKVVFENLPADDPPQRKPDLTKAIELIQYKAECSLEYGLQKTIDWYRQALSVTN